MTPSQRMVPRVPRFAHRTPLRFGAAGRLEQLGETIDLSPTGVGVRCAEPPEPGTRITLALALGDGREALVEGVVAWACGSRDRCLGARFGVRLTVADARFLQLVALAARRGVQAA